MSTSKKIDNIVKIALKLQKHNKKKHSTYFFFRHLRELSDLVNEIQRELLGLEDNPRTVAIGACSSACFACGSEICVSIQEYPCDCISGQCHQCNGTGTVQKPKIGLCLDCLDKAERELEPPKKARFKGWKKSD